MRKYVHLVVEALGLACIIFFFLQSLLIHVLVFERGSLLLIPPTVPMLTPKQAILLEIYLLFGLGLIGLALVIYDLARRWYKRL